MLPDHDVGGVLCVDSPQTAWVEARIRGESGDPLGDGSGARSGRVARNAAYPVERAAIDDYCRTRFFDVVGSGRCRPELALS
jgi:hypothetical protein